jgi:hypothetical protein
MEQDNPPASPRRRRQEPPILTATEFQTAFSEGWALSNGQPDENNVICLGEFPDLSLEHAIILLKEKLPSRINAGHCGPFAPKNDQVFLFDLAAEGAVSNKNLKDGYRWTGKTTKDYKLGDITYTKIYEYFKYQDSKKGDKFKRTQFCYK